MTGDKHPFTVIAVPTFRRVDRLPALITELKRQATDCGREPVRIVLVDNDPDRSAEPVARATGVEYVSEKTPGIAHVRRRALALGDPDGLVVMLDDDLSPQPGWLRGLISTWATYRPTVVVGFVRYEWPEGTDPWLTQGGFLRRNRHPDGASLSSLSTGSVLIDVEAARTLGVDFDPSLGLFGGEDSLFGRDVLRKGGTIVASGGSVAAELIPAERATRVFVRRRTIAHGESHVHLRIRHLSGAALLGARLRELVGGALRFLVFGGLALLGRATRDVRREAIARRRSWFAEGRMRGARGERAPEYSRDEL